MALRYEFGGTVFPLADCADCGLRFLSVQPAPESLAALYSPEYFESDYRCGRASAGSFEEAAFVDEDRGLLDAFEKLRPPGRLLDVGCASGWLLRHAAARGWKARGVEFSEAAATFARARGLDVFHGDLPAARFPESSFDLVYMGDVLEHVPDCRATLAEVARVLAPGGHLYLRGPVTTHSLGRSLALFAFGLAGRAIVLREPPYHLWEFTPGPLRRLLRAAGLEVVTMTQTKIPPGRPHGRKTALERAVLAALDVVNLPLTRWFGVLGDRVTLVARKPLDAPPATR
jgi:SAM-dependent methyltransferase